MTFRHVGKGWKKKKKNPGINPGQPAGNGWEKKTKKNPGINPGQAAGKGPEKERKKKNPVINHGHAVTFGHVR